MKKKKKPKEFEIVKPKSVFMNIKLFQCAKKYQYQTKQNFVTDSLLCIIYLWYTNKLIFESEFYVYIPFLQVVLTFHKENMSVNILKGMLFQSI